MNSPKSPIFQIHQLFDALRFVLVNLLILNADSILLMIVFLEVILILIRIIHFKFDSILHFYLIILPLLQLFLIKFVILKVMVNFIIPLFILQFQHFLQVLIPCLQLLVIQDILLLFLSIILAVLLSDVFLIVNLLILKVNFLLQV